MRKLTGIFCLLLLLGAFNFSCSENDTATEEAVPKCDRACLVELMDQYLAALASHDPAAVPIASNAKLVENITPIPVGTGLWETATGGPAGFKI
jgi:hypothetical protein